MDSPVRMLIPLMYTRLTFIQIDVFVTFEKADPLFRQFLSLLILSATNQFSGSLIP